MLEQVTQEQFCEVIEQAILSGDILRHIEHGNLKDGSFSTKQGMTYIPYRNITTLKTELGFKNRFIKYLAQFAISDKRPTTEDTEFVAEVLGEWEMEYGQDVGRPFTRSK
jgi:hypothetical protein